MTAPATAARTNPRLVLAIWIGLALLSGFRYVLGFGEIQYSLDLKYDFVSAFWLSEGRSLEALDRPTADRVGVSLGTPEGPYWVGPAQTHPPTSLLLARPLVPLGYRAAVWAWAAFSALALCLLARILLGLWRREPTLPSWRATAPFALALLLWPASVFNFAYGQVSALTALAVASVWWNLERGQEGRAAGWLTVALAIRLTPAVLFGHLALHRRRVAVRAAALFAAYILVSAPFTGGLASWRVFFRSSGQAVRIWEAWTDNTASLRGIFVRLFVDSRFVSTPFDNPAAGHALATVGSLALVALAFTFGRPRRGEETRDPAPVFALWTCLVVLLNPLAWTHNTLVLLLPVVLLAREGNPRWCRIMSAVVFVVLTIPRDALIVLAGGNHPYPASRGWILGLHAAAGLVLFAAACARASSQTVATTASANSR